MSEMYELDASSQKQTGIFPGNTLIIDYARNSKAFLYSLWVTLWVTNPEC